MSAWNLCPPVDWSALQKNIRHRDSLESKLLAFFDANPDEELAVVDACAKFGATDRANMSRLLKGMVDRSLLVRHWAGDCYVYQKGAA